MLPPYRFPAEREKEPYDWKSFFAVAKIVAVLGALAIISLTIVMCDCACKKTPAAAPATAETCPR